MAFDLTTLCVWGLRIVLPILFFAIYFRFQAPAKQGSNKHTAGPTTNVYTRVKLLSVRGVMEDCPAPETMKNIALKDQTEAPHLFAGAGRAPRADRSRRAPDENRAPRGEKREKKEKKEPEPPTAAVALSDDKMHMESLLNYVAFNRHEQQRVFLPTDSEDASPPPPPQKKAVGEGKPEGDKNGDRAVSSSVSGAVAQKANDEAQMVLRGAVNIQRQDVARVLYGQLIQANVEIAESTYELMIDVCLAAKDLKAASDFLMKLEDAGFAPNNAILDKVLDLYSTQQNEPEQEKVAKADLSLEAPLDSLIAEASASGALPAIAAKSEHEVHETTVHEASVVPMEYLMQPASFVPMFNWDAIEDSDSEGDSSEDEVPKHQLSSNAPEFVPSFIPGLAPQTEDQDPSKAKMFSAAAGPFQPQYSFDGKYPWGGQAWSTDGMEADSTYEDRSKGKAKGKGKGKWKSGKAEWDDGWHGKSGGSSEWDDGWQGKSGGGKGEWNDGWHAQSVGGDGSWNDEWRTKTGRVKGEGDHGSPAEEPRNEVEKKAPSKDAKNWKKPQMTWRPKGES